MAKMKLNKERPSTFPAGRTKSRHYPMWLYQCDACLGYGSVGGIYEVGGHAQAIQHAGCGLMRPVVPYRITEFVAFDAT